MSGESGGNDREPCDICGRTDVHEHANLAWDEVWGLIPGPEPEEEEPLT